MRALQRETGISSHTAADLRERLNFQCFKYELLVDMVRMPHWNNADLTMLIINAIAQFAQSLRSTILML